MEYRTPTRNFPIFLPMCFEMSLEPDPPGRIFVNLEAPQVGSLMTSFTKSIGRNGGLVVKASGYCLFVSSNPDTTKVLRLDP